MVRPTITLAFTLLWACTLAPAGALQPDRRVVNPDTQSNDSKPSLTVLADGSVWMAWHAYFKPSCDRVLARRVEPGELGPIEQLSGDGTVYDAPIMIAAGDGSAWAFWSTLRDGRWQLVGRRLAEGRWGPEVALSDGRGNALMPAAAALPDGRVLLAWAGSPDGPFRIRSRVLEDGVWNDPIPVSSDGHDSLRPAVAVEPGGTAWVVWDSYRDGNYAVRGRRVLPELGAVEPISPPGDNCLLPAALATGGKVAVAWVRSADVANAGGAIGQIHTLHAAVRQDGRWQMVRDRDGGTVAATCVHGLTAQMEPKPVYKLGHMARLRVPMLLADRGAMWLLWERKTYHSRHPAHSTADLAGRLCVDGQWREPVVFQSGLLDYRLAADARTRDGQFLYLASELPRDQRRVYYLIAGGTATHRPFHQDPWTGYEPIELPPAEEEGPRYETEAGGRRYRLFWADLHNHSGLTCDAHGEADELLHYARDRAKLDVVTITDNDEVFDDPLTEAEYALSVSFARHLTREGEFLALPGYEWTSHLPNPKDVAPSDPRCWDFRWFGRNCRSNHRTVVYPLAGGPLVRHTEVGNRIERLHEAVAAAGGVVFPHQGRWDSHHDPTEVGVEVASAWGLYFANPAPFHRALNQGYRYAFAGNSDSHRRNPGLAGALTGIYAESLTSDAILDALRNRRFYATNGSKIVLDSRVRDAMMGQEADAPEGKVRITLFARGTKPIVTATLIRDGAEIETFPGDGGRELRAAHEDAELKPGTHWYYWRVAQEGSSPQYPGNVTCARGHLAWSSPHWVVMK